jgi:hypothetical protein
VDGRVLVIAADASLATALGIGLVTGLRSLRREGLTALGEGSRGSYGGVALVHRSRLASQLAL